MRDRDELRGALTAWLRERLDDLESPEVSDLTPPSGTGYSSETVLFTVGGMGAHGPEERRFVARLQPTREGVFPSYDIGLQFDILTELAPTQVPVPAALWHEPTPDVLGSAFYVMAHVDGRVPSDNPPYTLQGWILEELDDDARRTMQTSALDTMARIHRLDPDKALGLVATRLRTGLDAELEYYASYFEWAAGGRPQPVAEASWEWILANQPPQPSLARGISWGDSRISNMIFGPDHRPVAVLDWEMATLNDPEMDLGWWLFLDRHFTDGLDVDQPPGFVGHDELVSRWQQAVGRPARNLWFWEVFAGFRFAVVMMRIAALLREDGVLPAESDFDRNNMVTQVLADMLDLPKPGTDAELHWGPGLQAPG